MVSLENYYARVVAPDDRTAISKRVKKHLDEIVWRLPDEEQFGMTGGIFIGDSELTSLFLVKVSVDFHTGDPMSVSVRDSNHLYIINNLNNAEYYFTLVTDGLENMSDDYIKGLIVYPMSKWSLLWRTANNIPNWEELDHEKRMTLLETVTPNRFPVGTREHEEYERRVQAEAQRLGFLNELLAYDIPADALT
ncbi:MAG: hypothetical protein KGI25_00920 [Thaumarchaeota archaeon]|nr:hypothetical protein [Nitrososphaerota archaeon]